MFLWCPEPDLQAGTNRAANPIRVRTAWRSALGILPDPRAPDAGSNCSVPCYGTTKGWVEGGNPLHCKRIVEYQRITPYAIPMPYETPMGRQNLKTDLSGASLRRFTHRLIDDVRALEYLLSENLFESGIRRIGAEQEMFLVDDRWQPAPIVERVLERVTDRRVVAELMRFNLELNLEPLVFQGDCLRRLERGIHAAMEHVHQVVAEVGARALLAGILPTITLYDLELSRMTPSPRYFALNEAISRLRSGPIELQIQGTDELNVKHDSITLEGCNTSFQTHFQVHPDEFPALYNIAQVVAGPVLAAATNSPTLFGKRLWKETRIALFQQSIDTRSSNLYLREMSPRVHFGTKWVNDSVTEIFKEDISRFRVLLATDDTEDAFAALKEGRPPNLQALQMHNGTVYRWNRACYGITNGKPTLRIENRILPSGPSVIDEMANAAFWFGLVNGLYREYPDIRQVIDFDDARGNFVAAARLGLASQLVWLKGHRVPAHDLICHELLPIAREGLRSADIDAGDVDRYLGVIEERVVSRRTGAQWQLESLATMKQGRGSRSERLAAIVAATVDRQQSGEPVHTWPLAQLKEGISARRLDRTLVAHYMSTDLFTVNEEELVDLVACLMDWQRIRHVLVEDRDHRLVGLVTHRTLLRFMTEERRRANLGEMDLPVKAIMRRDPVTVTPETSTMEAIRIMREMKIGSLPVVRDGRLIGIITEKDFLEFAGHILDENMAERGSTSTSPTPDPTLGPGR